MPHPVDIHVGTRLKHTRLLRNMSQTDLANGLGITFQQVQKYETGANRISASKLFELSQILKVEPCFFFKELQVEDEDRPADLNMDIVKAVAAITNDTLKQRVLTFINDVSGVTVAKGV